MDFKCLLLTSDPLISSKRNIREQKHTEIIQKIKRLLLMNKNEDSSNKEE